MICLHVKTPSTTSSFELPTEYATVGRCHNFSITHSTYKSTLYLCHEQCYLRLLWVWVFPENRLLVVGIQGQNVTIFWWILPKCSPKELYQIISRPTVNEHCWISAKLIKGKLIALHLYMFPQLQTVWAVGELAIFLPLGLCSHLLNGVFSNHCSLDPILIIAITIIIILMAVNMYWALLMYEAL